MSDQLVKIGLTCAVIVLGAGIVGSQLSNSPSLLQSAVSKTEDAAEQNDHAKKVAVKVDEEAEEEADDDVAADDSGDVDAEPDDVAAEDSPDESGAGQQEETAPDTGGSETADSGSGKGNDGEVVYNGIPAGTVTEDDE